MPAIAPVYAKIEAKHCIKYVKLAFKIKFDLKQAYKRFSGTKFANFFPGEIPRTPYMRGETPSHTLPLTPLTSCLGHSMPPPPPPPYSIVLGSALSITLVLQWLTKVIMPNVSYKCIISSSSRNTLVLLGFTKVIMPEVSCICIISCGPRNTSALLGFTKVIMPNVLCICIYSSSPRNTLVLLRL